MSYAILSRYFQDMTSFPLLTREEETEIAQNCRVAMDELKDLLLALPPTWDFLLRRWYMLRADGRSVGKMAEEYGSPHTRKKPGALSKQVDEAMKRAADLRSLYQYGGAVPVADIKSAFFNAGLSQHLYLRALKKIEKATRDPGQRIKFGITRMQALRDLLKDERRNLVNNNLRLVVAFAKKYQGMGVPLVDLIQEGNIGLIRAVEKYDHSREFRFSTYAAHWIKHGFRKAIKNSGRTIRLPSHIHDLLVTANKKHDEIRRETGKDPTVKELAEAMQKPADYLSELLDLTSDPIPLETPISRGSDGGNKQKLLKDYLAAEFEDPVVEIDNDRLSLEIDNLMTVILDAREKKVIQMRYGLGEYDEHTLQSIAEVLGKSRERVRQIEVRALEKLRENGAHLEDYHTGG